ncbi:uncharacterized protein [Drosophila tropicalis]|uniref:uncharacterized protein n=1 Tax=Drosophila tropicalis TaxID=46794 RepID=UPI0035AC2090
MKWAIIWLYLLVITKPRSCHVISEALDIIRVVKEVTEAILQTWDVVEKVPHDSDIELPILQDKQRKVMQRIDLVNQHITNLEKWQNEQNIMITENLTRIFEKQSLLSIRLQNVQTSTRAINYRYNQFEDYQNVKSKLEPTTLRRFAEKNVDPGSDSLDSMLQILYNDFFGIDNKNTNKDDIEDSLLSHMTKKYESSPDQICLHKKSAQQYAYDLFVKVSLTELKAYTVVEFSWITLRSQGLGNYSEEISLMRQNRKSRLNLSRLVLNQIMSDSQRVYWRCDPDGGYILGKTYDEITRLLQGYLENEVNLNENQQCWSTCNDYYDTQQLGCYQPEEEYCGKQKKCNGRLYNCRYIDSDMWICPGAENSTHRYKHIEFESGTILGKIFPQAPPNPEKCQTEMEKVESGWRYLFWHCSYCFCLCDEQGSQSDRFFNLRDTITDYQIGRVATGIRFVKSQRVFHLQLQQGQLLPNGAINGSSLEWLPIKSYDPDNVDVRSGVDYHILSFDSRTLDLDEVVSESSRSDHVVTGVRLRMLGKHINLEVRFSEYNFTTGRLLDAKNKSFWLSNDNTDLSGTKRRQRLWLNNPDLPINSKLKSLPLSSTNQFMDFFTSSPESDASQSTVPFIDTQDVVPNPVVPLTGLGLYHKGREGFGGFFAPKVITYDISKNFLKQLY